MRRGSRDTLRGCHDPGTDTAVHALRRGDGRFALGALLAPTIPTGEPTQARAGDTWRFTLTDTEFPSSEGWSLSYAINGASKLAWDASWVSSTTNTHTVTIPASATADLLPGVYEITRLWTGSSGTAGQVFSVTLSNLTILANPTTAGAGDRQSWEEKTLAVVEAVLAGRVTDDIAMYQIQGRTISKLPLTELLTLRSQLSAALAFKRTGRFGSRVRYAFTPFTTETS